MAPARGWRYLHLQSLRRSLIAKRPQQRAFTSNLRQRSTQTLSPKIFTKLCTNPSSIHQIYISRSLDPYTNLSIEHYLLQKSPAHSTVLFLYTNRPCVVIGRNQNPWVEVNLSALKDTSIGEIALVRRRSGGGTVFHDGGNVNYSVICPTPVFHRDRHAEMVVRALSGLGVRGVRVNARHDVVMDPAIRASHRSDGPDPVLETSDHPRLKVSGSAYKLSRLRALHHGTCLLSSPNLKTISWYLRSPAKPFIKARGVESVSSPIGNVGVENEAFEEAVVTEFLNLYDVPGDFITNLRGQRIYEEAGYVAALVGDSLESIPEIEKGVHELKSDTWRFLQTPQFHFSIAPEGDGMDLTLPKGFPSSARISLQARFGVLFDSTISTSSGAPSAQRQREESGKNLNGRKVHEVEDWRKMLQNRSIFEDQAEASFIGRWLNDLFGK